MKRLLALVTLVLAGSVGNAQATTINFENLSTTPGTEILFNNGNDPISGGFLFDAANHSHVGNRVWGTDNGSTFMVADDFLGLDPITVSQIGGAPFALTSIDISEGHNDAFFAARQVLITGNIFGGGTVSRLLVLDNNLVNNVFANYFQTFILDPDFGNLSSFTLTGMGALAGPGSNNFAIDNVVVNTAVPEPGTLTLLGLGSAYLFGRRRRNGR
jgi:hypothetical protein